MPTIKWGGGGQGPGRPEVDPEPHFVRYVSFSAVSLFVNCKTLTLSDQAQVTLQMRISLSDSEQRFLAGPPFLGSQNYFYHLNPNPLSAALMVSTGTTNGPHEYAKPKLPNIFSLNFPINSLEANHSRCVANQDVLATLPSHTN